MSGRRTTGQSQDTIGIPGFEAVLKMLDLETVFINEEFYAEKVAAVSLDKLLASGWRHFGTHFFRYNLGFYEFDIRRVIPLRIKLSDFSFSKSQRRTFQKNLDLKTVIRPIEITVATANLFERHRSRFKRDMPDSIHDFLSLTPATTPCDAMEVGVYDEAGLMAVSYFDVGREAISSIYAMFEPRESRRRLGIFTMLKEIEFALETGKTYFYLGYCYEGHSFYDYKKRFRALERFDWDRGWEIFEAE